MTVSEQIADELYGLHCEIGRLENENIRLRELAAKTYAMSNYLLAREPMLLPHVSDRFVEIDDLAHELGVEVDS